MDSLRVLSLTLLFALSVADALAQSRGTILGTVRDTSGAVVPRARITITDVNTNRSRVVISDDRGDYVAPDLPIGIYNIAVEHTGFDRVVAKAIQLQVEQQARMDFRLAIGSVTEEVTVVGGAVLLNTDDSRLGGIIGARQIVDLPLNGRNFAQLTWLLPGVNAGLTGSAVNTLFGSGIGISALGQRDLDNNITLDGAPLHNSINNATRFLPSIDAIEEFNVQTGIYSAEFGAQSGAQINIALKSGGNQFHGALFEFMRNDKLDARDFFSRPEDSKLPLRRNQFGGVLSGPVMLPGYSGHDRTFFMVNFEGLRERRSKPGLALFPTSPMRGGDFSAVSTPIQDPETGQPFPGNRIPSARFSPQAVELFKFMPLPNLGNDKSPNYITTLRSTDESDQFFTRIDQRLTNKHHLFGRYGYSDREAVTPAGPDLNTFDDIPTRDQNVILNLTSILGPATVNDLKISYNRDRFFRRGTGPGFGEGLSRRIGLTGVTTDPELEGLPSVSISGFNGLPGLAFDQRLVDDISHLGENFSYTHGAHFIKLGTDIQKVRQHITTTRNPRGTMSFTGVVTGNSAADLLLGYPDSTQRGIGSPSTYLSQNRLHFYALDDWKVNSRLTLNLGLRYEYNTVVTDKHGRIRSVDFSNNFALFPEPGVRADLYGPDRNNFAPRIGLAFRPLGDNRTVIRAGTGIFYNIPILNTISVVASNPPFDLQEQFNTNRTNPDLLLSDAFPSGRGQLPSIFSLAGIDPGYRTTYNQAWMANVQHMVRNEWVIDIGYTGSRTVKIDQSFNTNLPAAPGPGALQQRRPVPTVGNVRVISTSGYSTYNALLAKLEKRFSSHFSLLTSYTFSRTIGQSYSANIGGITPQDPYNLEAEKGLLPQHRKHNFVLSGTYELPRLAGRSPFVRQVLGGWQGNSIVTLRSGRPFTVTQSGNPLNNGGAARPNRICNGALPRAERTLDRYFDISCFAAPPIYTFGSSGQGILDGPGEANFDLSVFKQFAVTERHALQFRVEMFNAFNTPSFGQPGSSLGAGTFGMITSTKSSGREIQLGLKYNF